MLSAIVTPAPAIVEPPSLWEIVTHSGPLVASVLILLLIISIISWAIIFQKWKFLKAADKENHNFLDAFWQNDHWPTLQKQAGGLLNSQIGQMFCSAFNQFEQSMEAKEIKDVPPSLHIDQSLEDIERALNRTVLHQNNNLESLVPFLATTGSTAPFIGLFGTVLGIMKSFAQIAAAGSASLATVAPGISEALIATAVGLFAAIPAVMAYNFFLRKIKIVQNQMETFKNDFLNLARRKMKVR